MSFLFQLMLIWVKLRAMLIQQLVCSIKWFLIQKLFEVIVEIACLSSFMRNFNGYTSKKRFLFLGNPFKQLLKLSFKDT